MLLRGLSVRVHPDSDQTAASRYIGQGISVLNSMAFMATSRGETLVKRRIAIGVAGFMLLTWSIYYATIEIYIPVIEDKKKKDYVPYITILDSGTQNAFGFWANFQVPMYDTPEADGTMFHKSLWESYSYETANDGRGYGPSKNYVYMQKTGVVNGWVQIKDWPGSVLTECYNDPLVLSYDGRRMISTDPYTTPGAADGSGGATSNCGTVPGPYQWGLVGNKAVHTYSRLKATNSRGEVEVHIEITYEPGEPKVIWNVYTPEICIFPETTDTVIINKYYGTYPLYQ